MSELNFHYRAERGTLSMMLFEGDATLAVTTDTSTGALTLPAREAHQLAHALRGGVGRCDWCGKNVDLLDPLYPHASGLMCAECHAAEVAEHVKG